MGIARTRRKSVSEKARRQEKEKQERADSGGRGGNRSALLTQIELQGKKAPLLGRVSDLSIGGLLIETRDALEVNTNVVVRFLIPPGPTVLEAAGRVVRAEAGKLMAIAFLGLPDDARRKILDYIKQVHGSEAETLVLEPPRGDRRQRRSARIERRVAVVLSWIDDAGHTRQEAAETERLSRHGARVMAFTEMAPGKLIRVSVPDTGKAGLSRVVWTAATPVPGRVSMGLEFMGQENLWGVDFVQDRPGKPAPTRVARRRSARLVWQVNVTLNWVDEYGRAREEEGQTMTLSQHGAAVSALVGLPVKQRFRLRDAETGRETESHVVWSRPGDHPGRTEMGVEFLKNPNFWQIPFPPDPGSPLPQ